MTRWRPPPLLADSLLALAIAVLSFGLVNANRSSNQATAAPGEPRPGQVWNAKIVVPATAGSPLLTTRNTSTGAWITTPGRPTGKPGVYQAQVVLPDEKLPAPEPDDGFPGGLIALTLLAALPLALRRRHPLPVLAITLGAALAADVGYDAFPFFGPLVAVYTVARHVGRPTSVMAAGGTAAALPVLVLGASGLGFWESFALYALFAAAWLLGDNLRARHERRRANVGRAAAEEQARIGRELHDIIGHSVSVMTIQAAAAGDAFDTHPAQVREALTAIETTGRETLAELRRLLAGDAAGFAPSPGLDRLDALVERVRATGLAVELTAPAQADDIPPSVDLSAYRIVQEALTNTLKHAHASTARVDVRRSNGTLEIAVVDDGRAGEYGPPGHGIIGMRERAGMFGGTLAAGPAPGGGFAVHARIPL